MPGVTTDQVPLDQFGRILLEVESDFKNASYEQPLKDKVIPLLESGEAAAFAGGTTPSGTPWQPLAESTIRRKGHATILVDSERLRASLTSSSGDAIRETNDRGLIFGTEVPYSIFHEEGTQRIPQRRHVGMSSQTLDQLVEVIADATVEALKR